MPRPPLARYEDLCEALGDEAVGIDEDKAMWLLGRASAIVRAQAGVTWLDDDEAALVDVPPDIPGVIVGMVERATKNPTGTVQENAGPFGRSFGADAASRLYLTAMDKLVIGAAAGVISSGIGVLSTTRGCLETGAVTDRAYLGDGSAPEEYAPWDLMS